MFSRLFLRPVCKKIPIDRISPLVSSFHRKITSEYTITFER
jgi:hypothetical protein